MIRIHPAILSILAMGLFACSKADKPAESIEVPSAKGGLSSSLSMPKPMSRTEEAIVFAYKKFADEWIQREGGKSWVTRINDDGNVFLEILDYHVSQVQVSEIPTSEADNLNGLEWKGRVAINTKAYRMAQDTGLTDLLIWTEWSASNEVDRYILTKINGKWLVADKRLNANRPNISEIAAVQELGSRESLSALLSSSNPHSVSFRPKGGESTKILIAFTMFNKQSRKLSGTITWPRGSVTLIEGESYDDHFTFKETAFIRKLSNNETLGAFYEMRFTSPRTLTGAVSIDGKVIGSVAMETYR